MFWLLCLMLPAQAQTPVPQPQNVRKPLTIATAPKLLPAKWQNAQGKDLELRGQLFFSVAKAMDDDTLTGMMVYSLPDESRERLAKLLERPLKDIPPYIIKPDVAAQWEHGTSCPRLQVKSGEVIFEILGGKIHFKHVNLEFIETQEYLPQLFCHWTRQLNTKKQRRSIIAAINRALAGSEAE